MPHFRIPSKVRVRLSLPLGVPSGLGTNKMFRAESFLGDRDLTAQYQTSGINLSKSVLRVFPILWRFSLLIYRH